MIQGKLAWPLLQCCLPEGLGISVTAWSLHPCSYLIELNLLKEQNSLCPESPGNSTLNHVTPISTLDLPANQAKPNSSVSTLNFLTAGGQIFTDSPVRFPETCMSQTPALCVFTEESLSASHRPYTFPLEAASRASKGK